MLKIISNLFFSGKRDNSGLNYEEVLTLYENKVIEELKDFGIPNNQIGKIMIENILSRIKDDILIDDRMNNIIPQTQFGRGANSITIGIVCHLALARKLNKELQSIDLIRNEIYRIYGEYGAAIKSILERICPEYKLNFKFVPENEAKIAVNKNRPQIFCFALDDTQWNLFITFFKIHPKGILKKEYLVENTNLNWWDKITNKLKIKKVNEKHTVKYF